MSESLEESVKRFAEQARQRVIDEVKKQKNADTNTVEFQGFNADGKQLVKDGDEVRAVRETGNTSLPRGTKLLEDSASSVDTPRTKRAEDLIPSSFSQKLERQEKFTDKGVLIRQDELSGGEVTDKYWISWRLCPARRGTAYKHFFWVESLYGYATNSGSRVSTNPLNNYETIYGNRTIQGQQETYREPRYEAQVRPNSQWTGIYHVTAMASTAIYTNSAGKRGEAAVWLNKSSYDVPNESYILPYSPFGNPNTYNYAAPAAFDGGLRDYTSTSPAFVNALAGGESYSYTLYPYPPPGTNNYASSGIFAGFAFMEANPNYAYESVDEEGNSELVALDFRNIITLGLNQRIYRIDRIHSYYRKNLDFNDNDREVPFLYEIFIVVLADDFTDDWTYSTDAFTQFGRRFASATGRLSHKVVHLEINLETGAYTSRVNSMFQSASNTYDMVKNTTGVDYPITYLFSSGALFACDFQKFGSVISIAGAGNNDTSVFGAGVRFLDPTPIFTYAFVYDWIYDVPFTNNGFDTSDYSHWEDLLKFLDWQAFARYLGNFSGKVIKADLNNCNGFYACDPAYGTPNPVDFSTLTDISAIKSLVNGASYLGCIGSFYNFTGEGFRSVDLTEETGLRYDGVNKVSRTRKAFIPDVSVVSEFATPISSCFEERDSDYNYGDDVGTRDFIFHKDDVHYHDIVPIVSYKVIQGVLQVRCKYFHGFYPGDSISIFFTNVFDTSNVTLLNDSPRADENSLLFFISTSLPDTDTTPLSGAYAVLNT